MYNEIINKLKDKNICILGFGMEGKSTYNFIRRHLKDKHITIIDKRDISSLISDDNVNIICGDNYLDNLDIYDLIIKTPGISFNDMDITSIRNKITSQLELVLEVFKNNTIGITGTKGKSTTSTLLYKILKDQGRDTYLLGNIGSPILDDVEKYTENTYLVIEMSALQLEYIKTSPHIGAVLNLFQDHLDHSKTVEHYHENKMNMFKYQNEFDYSIYNLDNENTLNQINKNKYISNLISVSLLSNSSVHIAGNYVVYDNKKLYNINSDRLLIGNHNLSNIMFCLAISNLLLLDMDKVCKSINEFKPLEHRMEFVKEVGNIKFYNDSIATIPEATINACESLKCVDTLIFGGMDRGIEYDILIDYLYNCNISNLICMPTTGYKIGKILESRNCSKNIYYTESLESAVDIAYKNTKKGMICLMSPAASSYEYFKNFEEKGRVYKEIINKLK